MKINHLCLHSDLFIPRIGSVTSVGGGNVITTGKGAKLAGLTMEALPDGIGVKLTIKGISAVIPWANIKLALYDEKNS